MSRSWISKFTPSSTTPNTLESVNCSDRTLRVIELDDGTFVWMDADKPRLEQHEIFETFEAVRLFLECNFSWSVKIGESV